ncbi:MAG: folate family ECF transporter S component [Lachnospiraceae bacterium]|nr:folate family ECF transporter S component [Lachnospiraceae bacterium]MDY4969080.1 folate family ECF transporter S component [Lachnospiraceae bacterium]
MIISKKALNFKKQIRNLSSIQSLVLCAFFVAIYIVLYFCNIKITNDIQFRPGYLAIAAAGMYGGPIMGALTGAVGDVLSMLVTGGQGEVFFFGFTLSYALMGFFFGLVLHGGPITVVRGIAAALVEFLVSVFLNTYWLMIMYYSGQNYIALMITRIPKCLIMLVISSIVLTIIMKALYTAFSRARLLPAYE